MKEAPQQKTISSEKKVRDRAKWSSRTSIRESRVGPKRQSQQVNSNSPSIKRC